MAKLWQIKAVEREPAPPDWPGGGPIRPPGGRQGRSRRCGRVGWADRRQRRVCRLATGGLGEGLLCLLTLAIQRGLPLKRRLLLQRLQITTDRHAGLATALPQALKRRAGGGAMVEILAKGHPTARIQPQQAIGESIAKAEAQAHQQGTQPGAIGGRRERGPRGTGRRRRSRGRGSRGHRGRFGSGCPPS